MESFRTKDIYARNWQAKNLHSLARRIKVKVKQLDENIFQAMVKTIRKQLRSIWRNDLYSVFCLS